MCPSVRLRWGQPALSSGFSPACLWSCFRAGRSSPSLGGPSPSCCAWCSSSLPSVCCPGSTISPTSAASSPASSSPSPSCRTSASAAWTCIASAARSSSSCWCSWGFFQDSSCSSMSTPSSASGASCSPASLSQTSSARSMTSTPTSTETRVAWLWREDIGQKTELATRLRSARQACVVLSLLCRYEPPCRSSFLQSPPCSLTVIVTSSLCGENKGAALVNLNEAPSSPLHVRMQLDKPALVQREASFFTFTLQKTKVLLLLLLFRQPHTEAGTISDIDTFGALLINVPTTAIFLLRYAEHSNVFLCLLLLKK